MGPEKGFAQNVELHSNSKNVISSHPAHMQKYRVLVGVIVPSSSERIENRFYNARIICRKCFSRCKSRLHYFHKADLVTNDYGG